MTSRHPRGSRTPDWKRLASYVLNRRTQLEMTQEDVRAAGGPSTATMRLIEGALQDSYRGLILRSLESALQWQAGSVAEILDGGEPEPVDVEDTGEFVLATKEQIAAAMLVAADRADGLEDYEVGFLRAIAAKIRAQGDNEDQGSTRASG